MPILSITRLGRRRSVSTHGCHRLPGQRRAMHAILLALAATLRRCTARGLRDVTIATTDFNHLQRRCRPSAFGLLQQHSSRTPAHEHGAQPHHAAKPHHAARRATSQQVPGPTTRRASGTIRLLANGASHEPAAPERDSNHFNIGMRTVCKLSSQKHGHGGTCRSHGSHG